MRDYTHAPEHDVRDYHHRHDNYFYLSSMLQALAEIALQVDNSSPVELHNKITDLHSYLDGWLEFIETGEEK